MPLDGATYWQPSGWTIRVGLARALLAESRYWAEKKRRVFQRLALAAAYAAIDAIQSGHLHKRRDDSWLGGSWIVYYFRRDHREKRTLLITISHFHFFGPETPPDGPRGYKPPLPVDLLTLHVSGSGRRYRIDWIEGIMPLPRPPARNRIVSFLSLLGGGNSGYHLNVIGRPERVLGKARISKLIEGSGTIYYSPKGLNGNGRRLLEFDSLYGRAAVATMPRTGFLAQLKQAAATIGLRSRGEAERKDRFSSERTGASPYDADEIAHAVVQRNASARQSTATQARLQLQNRPIRPDDLR